VNAARLGISYKGPFRDLAGIGRNGMIIVINSTLTIAAITFIRNSSLVAERAGIPACLNRS
jgi:hypothetical protein